MASIGWKPRRRQLKADAVPTVFQHTQYTAEKTEERASFHEDQLLQVM